MERVKYYERSGTAKQEWKRAREHVSGQHQRAGAATAEKSEFLMSTFNNKNNKVTWVLARGWAEGASHVPFHPCGSDFVTYVFPIDCPMAP